MPQGTVKFFIAAKGYGFIISDEGEDVFLHISAMQEAGLSELNPDDRVAFEITQGRNRGQANATNLQLLSSAPSFRAVAPRRTGPVERETRSFGANGGHRDRQDARAPAGSGAGVVKWFNPAKGFGFIVPDSGGDDVFVHITTVERSGLAFLSEGQGLTFDLQENRRSGKLEATNLRTV